MSYTTLSHIYTCCWYDAAHNLQVYKNTRGLDLHWVCGASIVVADRKKHRSLSCGITDEKDDHSLLTGDELLRNSDNTHGWLEDKHGNVYDYFFPELEAEARRLFTDCPDLLIKPGVIEGVPKQTLAKLGYVLVPFPTRDQFLTALLRIRETRTPKRIYDLENATRPLFEKGEAIMMKEAEDAKEDDFPSILPQKPKRKRAGK